MFLCLYLRYCIFALHLELETIKGGVFSQFSFSVCKMIVFVINSHRDLTKKS